MFGVASHVGDPLVHVKVLNVSDRAIKTVTVAHKHGAAVAQHVAPGKQKHLEWFAPGEKSVRTIVEFKDGERLRAVRCMRKPALGSRPL